MNSRVQPANRNAFQCVANGRYAVTVTPLGDGFSALDDLLLTSWRPDPVEGGGGVLIYAREPGTHEAWTLCGRAAPGQAPGNVRATSDGLVIERQQGPWQSTVEVRVHDTFGLEERTCRITNTDQRAREIELTSYVEVVLNPPAAQEGHPAFAKLFVQTALVGADPVLRASRRARSAHERWPVLLHALFDAPVTEFTTERLGFIGRGRSTADPLALATSEPLARVHGNVLDPAMSLRTVLRVAPGESVSVRYVLAAGDDEARLRQDVEGLRATPLRAELARPTIETTLDPALSLATAQGKLIRQLTQGIGAAPAAVRARRPAYASATTPTSAEPLQFFNGYGGFSQDGREYVIRVGCDAQRRPQLPPLPWTNVIANPKFGCLVSESGAGNAWSGNSREHRLTPWANDPVSDPHGDAIYVRDVASGEFWCPTPGPAPLGADVEVRHGLGYTTWRQQRDGLEHELTLFVPPEDPLRVMRLKIRNTGQHPRRLAVYGYNRWVLGSTPEFTRATVRSEFSPAFQAVMAQNEAPPDGHACIAFAATDRTLVDGWCADRAAFLGVPGSPEAPAALLGNGQLSRTSGHDPCAVLQVILEIPPGASDEVSFLLGACASEREIAAVLARFRAPGAIETALRNSRTHWDRTLTRLQVETPSPALNHMLNGWLTYQDLSCRLWGRTAFYQSGGAFGFRDQLQDAAALVYLQPELTRAQILLHSSRQFLEGDVQHWWHPPLGQGLRTKFADDLLWLPWFTAYYLQVSGDRAILDERANYLTTREVEAGEAEIFTRPEVTAKSGDLYEHCCKAIDRSLVRGAHGLPLFGCGDWNDGMNRVGIGGRGESVWMGFFLYTVLGDFLPVCELRGDRERVTRYTEHRDLLRTALNANGWDGRWYRRGWYDDGTVLGSHTGDECRIDALVQAWAVMSKAAPPERIELALDSLDAHLVDDEARIVRLLTPPFVDTPHDPGYIKGYVAGVRENGGQYTHAATWVVRALVEAGRRDRAAEILESLLPVNHALTTAQADKYKVEPYVVAADVYGAEPHVGRGGWTWYTGSAGWLYRVAVESVLGFAIEGGRSLRLNPRIPDAWPSFALSYRIDDRTTLSIDVRNPQRKAVRIVSARLDGAELSLDGHGVLVPLVATGREQHLDVLLGE